MGCDFSSCKEPKKGDKRNGANPNQHHNQPQPKPKPKPQIEDVKVSTFKKVI